LYYLLAAAVSAVGTPIGIIAKQQVTAGQQSIKFGLLDKVGD
jgi:hypothetical protein